MRFVSWNVNGIRACLKKGFIDTYKELQADIFCVQETKAHPEQVEIDSVLPKGTEQVWAWAEKKGYSGCALFTPHQNIKLVNKLELPKYDMEGRGNIAFHKNFTLVNLYFPNGAASEERHYFKMDFLKTILKYLKKLEKTHGPLIICGDYNIAHTKIDIHDPKSNENSSGFLPEERAWMDGFSENFIDTFRLLHPERKDKYSWWSYRQQSRERNKGWRLDYFFISKSLKDKVKKANIYENIMGSDHCPIEVEISFS